MDPSERPSFQDMATEVDHLMEVSSGYLALSTAAAPREGEAMMEGDRSDTDSPEMERRLIKGVKTGEQG